MCMRKIFSLLKKKNNPLYLFFFLFTYNYIKKMWGVKLHFKY